MIRRVLVALPLLLAVSAAGESMDPAVPTPKSVLGYEIGEYHTSYLGVVRYVEALARAVPERVKLVPIGESYERRPMMLLVISTPRNIARLDDIKRDMQRLGDPRGLAEADAEAIVQRLPAVTWDNFGNDGNESAAVEAALEMAYRLAATRDGPLASALENVVAVLNICHNPESRERFVTWYNASQVGPQGNPDPLALEHRGPWGMDTNYNHYQIDLNRDSVWATQLETRNVIAAYRAWNPLTFIDHHGETENFFFPPVALPVNPNIPDFHLRWLETYGKAIAAVSDRRGWSYFTGETFDEFYPGYWDAYPFLKGGIGFTFETHAGGYTGLRVERDDETIITLRDGIDRHVEGGLAVLLTTARLREQKLRDYHRFRRTAVEEGRQGPVKAYVLVPGRDPARVAEMVSTLMLHGIEVRRLAAALSLSRARDYAGSAAGPRRIGAGAYVISLDQPDKRMAQALLEPETSQGREFVESERKSRAFNRLRGRNVPAERSAFYDVTAWALPYAYGVEAYASEEPISAGELLTAPPAAMGTVTGAPAGMAYLFDPSPLGSARLALALLREDFKVAVARRPFSTAGRDWPRGTFVVRMERNPGTLHDRIQALAAPAGVEVVGVNSAWTEKGIDLGSTYIDSLKTPRIAVIAEEPTDENAYGAIWFLLERRLDHPFTALRARDIAVADLSRYNVIVLPDGSDSDYREALGEGGIERLTRFAAEGGVVVCIGGAATMAVHRKVKWSRARLLGPPEEEKDDKEKDEVGDDGGDLSAPSAESGEETAEPTLPSGKPRPAPAPTSRSGGAAPLETEKELRAQGERRLRETEYTPGAIFAGQVDENHFLSFGYGGTVPVLIASSHVLTASPTGANVVRIRADRPRLAGFAWPEAEARLRGAAYLVDEPHERGHIVLFAEDPNFRTFWRGTEKLFTNALLLAPALR